ncbi:TetR family transcriptional regulator [Actinomadura sp. NBRC 104412]|uniref:TetR/AcrR family transcriptional regulator n=1 Tax=Actinomadura sp. NBRC 104412 TaxID=3032203 RepID=UPI0024A2AAF3|nr:TetR/AcrR family transcriptional regulator [Actinomadura sp. NBRC 104412]GLZ06020.1 TetR family transcriptional regulator [Actinomadura sp. NBRC 104412]
MSSDEPVPSARQTELLERAYRYALEHGLSELSLRPLATAIGSSPRVLLYLFGSKDGLVRALLARARRDELALLDRLRDLTGEEAIGLAMAAEEVWSWLAAPEHRSLLALWVEGYSRSLLDAHGPWGGFASETVNDWLAVLARTQRPEERDTDTALHHRTLVLAVLRGAMLDLLATGDTERTTAAVRAQLAALPRDPSRQV